MLEILLKIGLVRNDIKVGISLMRSTHQTKLKSSLINFADRTLYFIIIGNSQEFGISSHPPMKIRMVCENKISVLLYLKRLV